MVSVVSFAQLASPLLETSHCTVGAGVPLADALNTADSFSVTERLSGLDVIAGAIFGSCTVSVAPPVVADPSELENTARYSLPFCSAVAAVIVSVGVFAPASTTSASQ